MLCHGPPLLSLPLVPPLSLPLSLHLIQSLPAPPYPPCPPSPPLSSSSLLLLLLSLHLPPLFTITHPGIGLAVPNGGFGAASINVLEGFIDPLVGMNRVLNNVNISVLKNVLHSAQYNYIN